MGAEFALSDERDGGICGGLGGRGSEFVFDGIFDGDDAMPAAEMEALDDGGEGGTFAGAGHTADEDESISKGFDLLEEFDGDAGPSDGRDGGGDDAEAGADATFAPKVVGAAAQGVSVEGVSDGEIDVSGEVEFFPLGRGAMGLEERGEGFGVDGIGVGDGGELTVDAENGGRAGEEVEVGGVGLTGEVEP